MRRGARPSPRPRPGRRPRARRVAAARAAAARARRSGRAWRPPGRARGSRGRYASPFARRTSAKPPPPMPHDDGWTTQTAAAAAIAASTAVPPRAQHLGAGVGREAVLGRDGAARGAAMARVAEREEREDEHDDTWHAPHLPVPRGVRQPARPLAGARACAKGPPSDGEAAAQALAHAQPFGEKEFYLEEFRGRSVLIAVAPGGGGGARAARVAGRGGRGAGAQRHAGAWSGGRASRASSERRLAGRARTRAGGGEAPRARRKATGAPCRRAVAGAARWRPTSSRCRTARRPCAARSGRASGRAASACSRSARPAGFPRHAVALAVALRVPKVVLVDPRGGLDGRRRAPVVRRRERARDAAAAGRGGVVRARRPARAPGRGARGARARRRAGEPVHARRRGGGALHLRRLRHAVHRGRLLPRRAARRSTSSRRPSGCSSAGSARACSSCARPRRSPQVLGAGFGATVCGPASRRRRRAADGAVRRRARRRDRRALHDHALQGRRARRAAGRSHRSRRRATLGLAYVFACTVDERAQQFFERLGFARVGHDGVPRAQVGRLRRPRRRAARAPRLGAGPWRCRDAAAGARVMSGGCARSARSSLLAGWPPRRRRLGRTLTAADTAYRGGGRGLRATSRAPALPGRLLRARPLRPLRPCSTLVIGRRLLGRGLAACGSALLGAGRSAAALDRLPSRTGLRTRQSRMDREVHPALIDQSTDAPQAGA